MENIKENKFSVNVGKFKFTLEDKSKCGWPACRNCSLEVREDISQYEDEAEYIYHKFFFVGENAPLKVFKVLAEHITEDNIGNGDTKRILDAFIKARKAISRLCSKTKNHEMFN